METSTNKKELFSLLNDASLITTIGQTGSGKSQLIFSYLDFVTERYTPEEFKIRAYDVVHVDYWEKEPVMPWAEVIHYPEAGTEEPILADIQLVNDRVAGKEDISQRILIHINECDLFQTDFRELVIELCTLIAKHGMDINMQLIYETSRPAEPALPKIVVSMSDAKVLCPVPDEAYAKDFLGDIEIFPEQQGEMLVQTAVTDGVRKFNLLLERSPCDTEDQAVCPHCGSSEVTEYIYGLPGPELIEEARENKNIQLAGCVIESDSPAFYCRSCKKDFDEPD